MINWPNLSRTSRVIEEVAVQPRAWVAELGQATFKLKFKLEPLLVMWVAMLVATVAHAANMLKFPYFENDEGIYMSQAWAVLTGHGLANYTYWYDHPPVGWIQIALWLGLTGGPNTFGISVVSGRILMLLLHLGSCFFLFRLGQKLSGSPYLGAVAVLLFSLSPLAIYFQRRVLLDNFMTFWVLAAIYLIVCHYSASLGPVLLSALAYGIAVLSKEVGIVFLPALLYLLWTRLDKRHRLLALSSWMGIVFILGLQWFVYAILKGELFESGTLLGGTNAHVSLLQTLEYQASRGDGHGPFSLDNEFWHNMHEYWLPRDPFIVIAGPIATFLNLLIGWRHRQFWIAAFSSLCILGFLARGALVIEYYIVPAIPFFALNIALLAFWVFKTYRRFVNKLISHWGRLVLRGGEGLVAIGLVVALSNFIFWNGPGRNNFVSDQTTQQLQALDWAENNLPPTAFVATDQYDLLDLQAAGLAKAHSHWKVARDPDVREKILDNDWHNIDYIVATPQVINDIDTANLDILKEALDHSSVVKSFKGQAGWDLEIRKINPLEVASINVTYRNTEADGSRVRNLDFNLFDYKQSLSDINLLMDVRSASGELIYKATLNGQDLTVHKTKAYSIPIRIPAGIDETTLRVTLGVFDKDWHYTYLWQEYVKLL